MPFDPGGDDNQIYPVVTITDNGRVIVAWRTRWGARTIRYAYSDDGGANWVGPLLLTDPEVVELRVIGPGLAIDSSGTVWGVWVGDVGQGSGIHYQVSEDDGVTWSVPALLWHVEGFVGASVARTVAGLVLSWWEEDECFGDILGGCTSNIWYSTSAGNGATWSERDKYTEFKGDDWFPSVVALQGGGFALTWASRRRQSDSALTWASRRRQSDSEYSEEETIWFGNPAMHQDDVAPPAVLRREHFPV